MQQWSRRRALRAAAATASTLAVAGCNAGVDDGDDGGGPGRDAGNTITDYETTTARADRVFAPFWLETYDDPADRPSRPVGSALVTEPPSEAGVTFHPESELAASLRSFAEDTDFGAACVYLWSTRVGGCDTVAVTGVRRRGDAGDTVELSLCRRSRPPDVACERDAEHTVGLAVRLPFGGEDVRLGGVSVSGDCRDGDDDPAPVTPIGGGGE